MDFVRKCGGPTPKVYAYSTTTSDPVGAEYIIIEKAPGQCLGDIWFALSDKQRVQLLGNIVEQEAKLFDSLRSYLDLVEYLIPEEDWRHSDLNPNNIFVDADLKILSIIDWQHSTTVLPLFLHTGIPAALQNYGDPESEALKKPTLPPDLEEMEEDDREKELELYRRRHVHFYYVIATAAKLKLHYRALYQDKGLIRKKIYQHATEPWEGNSIPLKADLVALSRSWSDILPSTRGSEPCPITFTEEEASDILRKMTEQVDEIDPRITILRDCLGLASDGWVAHEHFENAVTEAGKMKVKALGFAENDVERAMTEQHWPFDDYDEDE